MATVAAVPRTGRGAGLVNTRQDLMAMSLLGLVALLVPLAFPDAGLLGALAVMFIYMAVNIAWNLILGVAGTFSFGQLAFFVAGAYTSAILNVHEGISPFLDTVAAAVAGALSSLLIGLAVLRLRGVYVALVTLSFHQLLSSLVATDYSGLTGGPNGLTPIEPYVAESDLMAQSLVGYWAGLGGMLVTFIGFLLLIRSPIGLALVSARDAEQIAGARGVKATRYRMIAFVFSGLIAGVMGGVYAHYVGVVSPAMFSFGILMMLLSMIIVGGWGTVWGPVIGTASVTLISRWIQGSFPEYQPLILASIVVLAILFFRGGLASVGNVIGRRIMVAWERLE
jgi:ABC-type branched-subunit amino acid transport system permease subunit